MHIQRDIKPEEYDGISGVYLWRVKTKTALSRCMVKCQVHLASRLKFSAQDCWSSRSYRILIDRNNWSGVAHEGVEDLLDIRGFLAPYFYIGQALSLCQRIKEHKNRLKTIEQINFAQQKEVLDIENLHKAYKIESKAQQWHRMVGEIHAQALRETGSVGSLVDNMAVDFVKSAPDDLDSLEAVMIEILNPVGNYKYEKVKGYEE